MSHVNKSKFYFQSKNLVRLKTLMDHFPCDEHVIIGDDFASVALPFWDYNNPIEPASSVELVDPFLVLGGCYLGSPTNISIDNLNDRADYLNKAAEEKNTGYAAQYYRLDPFGIYIPCEGKNRVDMYRKLKRKIKAIIIGVYQYPDPDHLEMFPIKGSDLVGLRLKTCQDLYSSKKINRWQKEKCILKTRRWCYHQTLFVPFLNSVNILSMYGVNRAAQEINADVRVLRFAVLETLMSKIYRR